ncbi:MAG: secondary thiamine-phosphate synthase enzyme YjbQ [Bacillota bacterium]
MVAPVSILELNTGKRVQFIDITAGIRQLVEESGVGEGVVRIFIPHTTAAVTINENADPSVVEDIIAGLEKIAPRNGNYRHGEGNADAHIKATLVGSSLSVLIGGGKLMLGTWQGIFFCEFDGPRRRKVLVTVRN